MITIFHNPRCRKSREGLAILEKSGKTFEVVKYLEDGINQDELKSIVEKLGIDPIDLVRKTESIWKENFKGKNITNKEVIEAMAKYPKLMERPIVINEGKAVVGRPPEKIKEII